jgi:transposase, IS5 family
MKQRTLAMMNGFERYSKKTRRAAFLEEMEQVVPWAELCALIEPVYPKAGNGRQPVGVERMLRVYFLQQWFNLSDPAVEEALYDSAGMRQFVGIDLGNEPVPDETTVCKFRHLLEQHDLGAGIFARVNEHLQGQGIRISTGTIVDATIISAPSSTKNARGERDPGDASDAQGEAVVLRDEGARRGRQQEEADSLGDGDGGPCGRQPGLTASVARQRRMRVGRSSYRGQSEVIHRRAPRARDCTQKRYRYQDRIDEVERAKNRTKSRVRSKVEHVFGVMKLKFGFTKVRYRGLRKNANRLFTTCALVNLFLVRKRLLGATAG